VVYSLEFLFIELIKQDAVRNTSRVICVNILKG
jgi:hypothetical protein